MKFFKEQKEYKVKKSYLKAFLREYWFIPSDVLQRAVEANIWDLCHFAHPVLSIGIGNGNIDVLIFKKHGTMEVGIDSDGTQLDVARKLGLYEKVQKVNAERMPFKESSFSTVISNSTFEHIRNDKKAVSEVSRILKPGGLFFFTTPSNFLQEWIFSIEKGNKKKLLMFNKRASHFHYHSLSEWSKLLDENNLDLIFHRYYFPKKTAVYWYRLFKIFTYKKHGKEIWSYIGHSKITKLIPKRLTMSLLESLFLERAFRNGFLKNSGEGAQHFIIAKKR